MFHNLNSKKKEILIDLIENWKNPQLFYTYVGKVKKLQLRKTEEEIAEDEI